jgi:hypothetical protein
MSQEGYLSCASCHFDGFEDGRIWDFTDRGEGFRNTISLLGRRGAGHGRVHWSANFDEIHDFETAIRQNQAGGGFLPDELYFEGTRSEPLGDPKAGLSPDLDALVAYVESLVAVNRSPFRNPDGTLTEPAEAGKQTFERLECGACHAGADFTDSSEGELHDVGTLKESSGSRLGGSLEGIDTPTLLGIWETAPYLHDGSAPTLRDVLTTENPSDAHGAVSTLASEELDELIAYLEQIDGDPPVRPLPFEDPGASGAGGAGGTGDAGDAQGGASDAGAPSMSASEESGGCALAGHRGPNRSLAWLFSLVALVLVARNMQVSFRRPHA